MISGKLFRDAIINGSISLDKKRKQVDELNVYPVPDGDTGTNMSMTISAARKEVELLSDDADISEVADTAAAAMLRGARGNSGVILSILFRGFSRGMKGLKVADCGHIANSLELGVDAAYKAVMKPTEGTILTVAKMAAQAAGNVAGSTNEISIVWEAVCNEASRTLEKTPELLPVLKKSGVVDAGGKGLVIIFKAMLEIFKGGSIQSGENVEKNNIKISVEDGTDEEIKFT